MQSFFTPDFFAGNREKLREKLAPGTPIVVPANGLLQRNGDTTFPFVQDSNFWYLTGIDEPDCMLVMTAANEFLMIPDRDAVRVAFDGAVDSSALAKRSGINEVLSEQEGWKRLRDELSGQKQIAIPEPPQAYLARHGLYTNPARRRSVSKLKRSFPKAIYIDIRPHMATLRCMKQAPELAALQQAIDITTETIADIQSSSATKLLAYEYQLEAAVTQGFRSRGASGQAFTPIVANGKKATTLHNVSNDGPLAQGQLTILDIGAEVEHYAADISRTISFTKPSARQQAVYDAVVEVQAYAIGLLKPGVEPKEFEEAVSQKVGEKLVILGFIKTLDHDKIRHYFPHATSHYLGLDTHDVGDYRVPYAPGMVVTCEPGIYIPEEGIGVRIEDDVLITETGNTVLSAACPRQAF